MSCLDSIIGIKDPCTGVADVTSLSGYNITDYPGITIQTAANTNDEKTATGYNYLVDIRRRAMLRLKNDLMAYINSEYRVNSLPGSWYSASKFVSPATTIAAATGALVNGTRGVVISKRSSYCRFHKIILNRVRIYSEYTGDVTLKISDVGTGVVYTPTVALVEGTIQEFELNKVINGSEVQITLPGSLEVYSSKPNCGCGGQPVDDLFQSLGLTITQAGVPTTNTSEGYGIEVDVTMKCDLSTLICDLATDGIIGQAAYELCGAMFYDEAVKNNRITYLTVYKGEQLAQQAAAGFAAYRSYMEQAMAGMRNYLVNADGNCKCVDCSGITIKTNV